MSLLYCFDFSRCQWRRIIWWTTSRWRYYHDCGHNVFSVEDEGGRSSTVCTLLFGLGVDWFQFSTVGHFTSLIRLTWLSAAPATLWWVKGYGSFISTNQSLLALYSTSSRPSYGLERIDCYPLSLIRCYPSYTPCRWCGRWMLGWSFVQCQRDPVMSPLVEWYSTHRSIRVYRSFSSRFPLLANFLPIFSIPTTQDGAFRRGRR